MMLFAIIVSVRSRPARGGWIEIDINDDGSPKKAVPPRTGRVD